MLPVYRTVKQASEVKLEINKSLFIAYVSPAETEEAAVNFVQDIKKRHKEANHNCSAYVIGLHGQYQKADDDGEPGGTAGKPILEVINKSGVKNAVIVVTRYFGGIKLGAGGLIRAYTKAAADGLEAAFIIEKQLHTRLAIELSYHLLGTVENQLRLKNYPIEAKEFTEVVKVVALARKGSEDKLIQLIADATAAQAKVQSIGELYLDVLPET
ncbi:YigZ family protein [Sporomusa sp.]|uniref:YigZ family protein n=1 Tax=Sporomusa sp. TaxID=2078658 RepID=UPI002B8063FF|nr:YigZ family protein [Sporomusa sp.]HWR42591.1 YigZ family protein [Sporomusa sp.]